MNAGLDGIVAATTRLSHVDGEAGRLVLAGYEVEDLASRADFEEVAFLLLHGALPDASALDSFRADLASRRALPQATRRTLSEAAAVKAPPIDALRMAAATLSLGRGGGPAEDALNAIAGFATIAGSYWRLFQGLQAVPVRTDLCHAAHYLHQVTGVVPDANRSRAVETYLNTVIDHGLNASTFAARVIAATRSDVISAVTGAVGALKGPLHGGAPGPALDMILEADHADGAEAMIRGKLDRGERLMGFGHRIYRVRDPRADVLAAACKDLTPDGGQARVFGLAREVEAAALRMLRERKPDRRIDTNVEFYTALLLHGIGLPAAMFTVTFAVGRVAGWCAHCLEQLQDGRLIRPQSEYTGPAGLRYRQ